MAPNPAVSAASKAASAADDAYQAALVAAFGPKASRWNMNPENAAVSAARVAKLAADEQLYRAWTIRNNAIYAEYKA